MTHLLEKETPFVFSKECVDVFDTLKKKLTETSILVVPDWNLPFELMCDASDFTIGAVSNRGLKRILERTVRENSASWSDKLDDALWAFRIAFKTPIGCTPYKLVYEKSCHLSIELEHRVYWALKYVNFDLKTAGDHRKLQLNELNELRKLKTRWSGPFTITQVFSYGTVELSQPNGPNLRIYPTMIEDSRVQCVVPVHMSFTSIAYENSVIYKERTKKLHDSKIKNRIFNVGDQVLLFNSRLKIFSGKLKTRWSGPFTITQVFSYGTVELSQPTGPNFKVNGHRVKHYFGGNIPANTSNTLHNAIMEAGGKDRPPMLAPGNYIQWKSRIKRYIETKPNHELIHYYLKNPPYKFTWADKEVLISEEIERLKQGESINVQDLETNLYWEFRKFTSRDGESLESYYLRFYKMMNELVRNQYDVTNHQDLNNHQVNVQFLLQLQPKWQRFVTLIKQSQELKTVLYHKVYDILKQYQNEVNELRAERIARAANPLALVAQQQPVYHPQNHPTHYTQNSLIRSQQAATRNRGKVIVNSLPPIYDQEPSMVAEDDEMSKDKEIDKLMALIFLLFKKIYKPTNNNLRTSSNTNSISFSGLQISFQASVRFHLPSASLGNRPGNHTSRHKEIDKLMALISLPFKKIYKPTNNNLRTSSNTSRANQDNSPRIHKNAGYESQRSGNVAGARETVGSSMVQKSRIQCYNCKEYGHVARECQKPKRAKDAAYHREKMLLSHYMYMAKIQEVSPDAADFGPIFDTEPLQKVLKNDHYNMFAIESEHPEQSKSVNEKYPIKQDGHNVIIDSLDKSYDREQIDQNVDDDDLTNERELLAFLIEKLKCEIDDSKNRNKFLETSNKVLVEKLKGEIEDFKTQNKSLESSNNYFKEANNKLSETNKLMYIDLKKFQAELVKRNDVEYASKVEIDCAKDKRDLISYKMKSQKSFNKYTQHINDLNQTISEMKKELSSYQETISILSQTKEAQIKLYKTREDKELDKVIALETKVKVLDNTIYKTGQSVQIMNMLNRNCKTSFAKPEFLKKAQRANPRLTKPDQIKKKGEAWRSPKKSRVVSVDRTRKTEENAKRLVENARTVKKLLKFKERKKRQGPDLQFYESNKWGTQTANWLNLYH
nr:reverse transcriptase domain-containing protein [Tanacetum cinerariifolium]